MAASRALLRLSAAASRFDAAPAGHRGDDRLVERIGFRGKVLIPTDKIGETVGAGGKPCRELVDRGGSLRLRGMLDGIERLVRRHCVRQQLLLRRRRQDRQRHAELRALRRDHALDQRQGVAAVSFIAVERREVVHERRGFRMIRSDGLFADRKGAPEQRLGVGITVLALIEIGEIV
jgi:hypothetical protein